MRERKKAFDGTISRREVFSHEIDPFVFRLLGGTFCRLIQFGLLFIQFGLLFIQHGRLFIYLLNRLFGLFGGCLKPDDL
jgi:hypothetical protein